MTCRLYTACELESLRDARERAAELYYYARKSADDLLYPTSGYNTLAERVFANTLHAFCNSHLLYREWADARAAYTAAKHHTFAELQADGDRRFSARIPISQEYKAARDWLSANS
jgi:hypothetical protein